MQNSVVDEVNAETRAKVYMVGVRLVIFAMWLFGAINTFLLSISMFDGVSMLIYSLLLVCSVDIALVGFKWARDNVSTSDGEIKWSRFGFWYTFAVNALLVVLYQVYFARGGEITEIIETRIALAVGVHIALVSMFYYLWQDANPVVEKRVLRNQFKAKVNALQLEKLAAGLKLDTRKIEREIHLIDSIDAAQFDDELDHVTRYLPDHEPQTVQTAPTEDKFAQLIQLVQTQQQQLNELTKQRQAHFIEPVVSDSQYVNGRDNGYVMKGAADPNA